MREILFRGFNRKNNRWLYGCYIQNRGSHFVCPDEFAEGKSWQDYEVDPATIGQYTGLRDKNGDRIFEGDILRYPPKERTELNNYVSYEVFLHDNDCADRHIGWQMNRYHYHGNVCGTINDFTTCFPKYTEKMTIIGNIHDNNIKNYEK